MLFFFVPVLIFFFSWLFPTWLYHETVLMLRKRHYDLFMILLTYYIFCVTHFPTLPITLMHTVKKNKPSLVKREISSCKRRREYLKSTRCRILGSIFQQFASVRDEQKEKTSQMLGSNTFTFSCSLVRLFLQIAFRDISIFDAFRCTRR